MMQAQNAELSGSEFLIFAESSMEWKAVKRFAIDRG